MTWLFCSVRCFNEVSAIDPHNGEVRMFYMECSVNGKDLAMPDSAGAGKVMRTQSLSPSLCLFHFKWEVNHVRKSEPGESSHLGYLLLSFS